MPKPSDPDLNSLIVLFKSVGLSQSKATEAAKSPKSAAVLKSLIEKHKLTDREERIHEKQAGLLASLAVQIAKSEDLGEDEQAYVLNKILQGDLKSVDQITGMELSFISWTLLK
jgi:glutaminyl-tRNA synthetase